MRRIAPTRLLLAALAALCLLSLALAAWPERDARPVVGSKGIVVSGGFEHNNGPLDYEARRSISQSPELAVWRTWNATRGSLPGDATTEAFQMPAVLAVPYQGFAGEPGIWLRIECIASGRSLDVAVARTNTQWSEALVRRPANWCVGPSRLHAHSDSRAAYLAFGTPFKISTISWLKTQPIGLIGIFALTFLVAAGACVGAARLLARAWPDGDPLALGFIGFGLAGYLLFFSFYFFRRPSWIVALVLALFCLYEILRLLRRGQGGEPAAASTLALWREPLLAWACVASAYFFLLYAMDNGAGAWLANARFSPVRWSTDNQIPMFAGEYLARLQLALVDIKPWQVSDRTPLSYGLHAGFRVLSLALTRATDGFYLAPAAHTITGIVLNTSWVAVLVHMLRSLGLGPRMRMLALATAALLPFCLFNSVYVWPKLFGASFGLLAIWVLLLRPSRPDVPGEEQARWLQAALLSALSLLCHGGAVFGIVAMIATALVTRGLPKLRVLSLSAVLALALIAPWTAWQQLVQPPGNALMKSVFAGTYGFDEPKLGTLATIRRSYERLPPSAWLEMKRGAVRSLLLPPVGGSCAINEMAAISSRAGSWRVTDFLALAPSLKWLWLGLLVPVALLRRSAAERAQLRPAHVLLGAGLLGIGIEALLAWDCHIIHTQSYQSILAIVAGLLLFLLGGPWRRFGVFVSVLSMGYGLLVWVVEPLATGSNLQAQALVALVLVLAGSCIAAMRSGERLQ